MHKFCKKLPSVIGMLHVPALPGAPLNNDKQLSSILDHVKRECDVYSRTKVDGILVENMFDVPYQQKNNVGPEVTAFMTRICCEVRNVMDQNLIFGVQILAGCNKEALAVALASNFDFIRTEGYVFAHIADEGWTNACASELQRYKKYIGAKDISVFADIKKKHCSHAITSDLSIEETAEAARFFLADGVILTGSATGKAADFRELERLKCWSPTYPVIIGSGVTTENVAKFQLADALVVGSHFKEGGRWENKLDEQRVRDFMTAVKKIRRP